MHCRTVSDTRSIIITGAASGIGESCYRRLAASSEFTPFGIDVKASSTTDLILNMADETEINEAVGVIQRRIDLISGLVNCAGVQIKKPITDLTQKDWLECILVNAVAPFLFLGKLVEFFELGGSVVNIGSVHSKATTQGMAAYSASKGALAAGTRAAALEVAKLGIRVNCISPGAVHTDMLLDNILNSDPIGLGDPLQMLGEAIPLGRIGLPAEVAELVVFLLSDKSQYITGQEFFIDGGVVGALASETPRGRSV